LQAAAIGEHLAPMWKNARDKESERVSQILWEITRNISNAPAIGAVMQGIVRIAAAEHRLHLAELPEVRPSE
jgi:hypothetical protein